MVIVGIDEVGRGCWAGPMVAAAVALDQPIAGLKDSKMLSKKKRNELDIEIRKKAVDYGIGWVSAQTIDAIGLTAALKLAMSDALSQIEIEYDELIIDGISNIFPNNPKARALIKADSLVPSVSAASIIAKVARDNYMTELAKELPDYGFDKHVGYGTALHMAQLQQYGITAQHRRSFKPIRAML